MSKREKLLALLSDGKRHSNDELAHISFRFGALIHNLRKEGYCIETIRTDGNEFSYQLISAKKEGRECN